VSSGADWVDVGASAELAGKTVQEVRVGTRRIALTHRDGEFGAISGICNHVGGPLGEGDLEDDFVVCPWHYYKFHWKTGEGEPGYEADRVPSHAVKVENGRVLVSVAAVTKRGHLHKEPHPLARTPVRDPGPVRILGLSTTVMTRRNPRYSTSEDLLLHALANARESGECECETRLIKVRELSFRACEGYYSKSARACTWPCSITQMDSKDQMDQVYEGVVHWADVILIATPIRWGGASSLYYKMIERMNCIQNQETIANRHLLRNKVVALIVTGGQDNVQAVVGQVLTFFAELGCQFPQFPFIAHSRGWSAEDMERNVAVVQRSEELREAAGGLVDRGVELAQRLLATEPQAPSRGGRKGQRLRSADAALAERAADALAEAQPRSR
jgi:nitrite reductase/ring-hydroxylating ferredoxin subunit/multimeric flavodoxin WrbA